jgi:hypothetical protein
MELLSNALQSESKNISSDLAQRLVEFEKREKEIQEGMRYAGSLQQSILPN